MHLPFDYPRINQFPEWFTVEPGRILQLVEVWTRARLVTQHLLFVM